MAQHQAECDVCTQIELCREGEHPRFIAELESGHKLNYEALGNQCHHLHWHVFPRYTDEPSPWEPVWKVMPEDFSPYNFDPAEHGDIILAIRAQLGRSH
ncbi:MAG: hypothetical protein K8R88_08540 [Armatimonadetes bacterium]|nr:hypothetical protein [Armatimonadota bacterium]